MPKFNVPVSIDGKDYVVPVEAPDAETAKLAVQQQYAPQPERATDESLGETAASFVRGAATGVGDILDIPAMLVTAPAYGLQTLGAKLAGKEGPGPYFGDDGFMDISGAIRKGLGGDLSQEASIAESFGRVGGNLLAGFGVGTALRAGGTAALKAGRAGVGSRLQSAGNFLTAEPKTQVASALTGQTAIEVARANGVENPLVLAGLGLGGAVAVPAGLAVGGGSVRRVIRGPGKVKKTARDKTPEGKDPDTRTGFQRRLARAEKIAEASPAENPELGTLATLVDGSTGRGKFTRAVERSLGQKTIRIEQAQERVSENIGRRLQDLALKSDVADRQLASLPDAGELATVVKGNVDGYLVGKRRIISELYDELEDAIDPTLPVTLDNTATALQELTGRGALTQALMKNFGAAKVRKMQAVVDDFTANGQVSFEDLKELRSAVGRRLGSTGVMEPADREVLTQLYRSLSEDLRDVAARSGDEALDLFVEANDTARSFHTLVDDTLRPIQRKIDGVGATDEDLFDALVKASQASAARRQALFGEVDSVFANATQHELDTLRAGMVVRLGRSPSTRNVNAIRGGKSPNFDLNTFLRNIDSMDSEAAGIVFGDKLQGELRSLAKTAGNIQRARQATSQDLGLQALPIDAAMGLVGWGLFGGPLGAAAVGGVTHITVRYLAPATIGRLMAKPQFLRWLGQSTDFKSLADMRKHFLKLEALVNSNPEIAEDVQEYMEAVTEYSADIVEEFQETSDQQKFNDLVGEE